MTHEVTPTDEQIIAEAERRFYADQAKGAPTGDPKHPNHYIIEVMREGWTPPKPVDPDSLAFRARARLRQDDAKFCNSTAVMAGKCDHVSKADAYLDGVRMATERERERAKVLLAELDRFRQYGSRFDSDRAAAAIAKYEEGKK